MSGKVNIGCDMSKQTLDFYCMESKEQSQLENSQKGLQRLSKWMSHHQYDLSSVQIAFELTGMYGVRIRKLCEQEYIAHYSIPGLEIKKSMGISRGKNDALDSKRIAEYLQEKSYKLTADKNRNETIEQLKAMDSLREKLV